MKALKLTVVSWLLVATALAAGKQPDFVTQEVTGEAAIVAGDTDKAVRDARNAALREAVEKVVGVRISAQTLTSNNQLIQDKILSRSDGYVRKYDIVDRKEEGGVMKVTLRAQVGTTQLDKDLQAVQALIQQLGNKKLVILVYEQTVTPDQASITSQTMSTVLTEAFMKDGWTIIDPAFAMGKVRLQPGATALSNAEAKEIGDLTKADYILYGNVTYQQIAPNKKAWGEVDDQGNQLLFFVSGGYDLSIFETASGSQLAKVSGGFDNKQNNVGEQGKLTVSYERTAYEVARVRGEKVVAEVRTPVVAYLNNAFFNGSRVSMSVVGLTDYAAVQGFKKVLAKELSSGLRELGQGTFSGGKGQFDLTFLGTMDDLAEAVSGKTYKGKKVSVTGVGNSTIELTLAR
ncbi:flagellar assembly protein T N-terminal domain-containing protein [Hyalangium rubrum]|uniref:Flagellar assembly protein T N-terminal domain-containing protein n=1 Tax=Hyalangium rubrum TaxID=3103134 RepID=A0ABU5HHJ2_9BACT|nr:flagellar assembly protein T N-terminal domain-containing protein [Hyalangium sp. s54d21]MDY7231550.1 flagellar assembly protein T N-terminal domain-containing protein [Hyalangium sp. s54d21]